MNKGEPWASLWHYKYAKGWSSKKLIHLDQNITGSPICQVGSANKHLVKENNLWEVGNG